MRVILHKEFEKRRFKERRNLFMEQEFHPLLENHPLQGTLKGYRGISIGGDLRVVYKTVRQDVVVFVTIGSHSELYS